jgi:sulfur-oxidizing protein SoxX
LRLLLIAAVVALPAAAAAFEVVDDAIPAPLTAEPGDPVRGRAVVAGRQVGTCVLCHAGPFPEERVPANIAPDLRGVGDRLSAGQIRLRLVDSRLVNPETVMPAYYSLDGLVRVGAAWRGRTVLSAQQIEDAVAFLSTLKEE